MLLVACATSNEDHMKIVVLQELYFMEKEYGKEKCDYFLSYSEITEEIKDKYPEASNELLEECQKLRQERSKNYNR